MYDSVRAIFPAFSDTFEGHFPCMYLDTHDPPLVTTGRGNLIDPMRYALELPWQLADGSPASQSVIASEWAMVKTMTALAKEGADAAMRVTHLRLSEPAIDDLCETKLAENEKYILAVLPDFQHWPADAQLALMSMCWATGPGIFPRPFMLFTAASQAQRWDIAATQCKINETGNPGLIPRNKANSALFEAARLVAEQHLDPTIIHANWLAASRGANP